MLDHCIFIPAQRGVRVFKGRTQAVITNKPDPFSTQILEALGIANYFIDILTEITASVQARSGICFLSDGGNQSEA